MNTLPTISGRSNGAPRTPAHAAFAARLRVRMIRRGVSRLDLARLLDVSPTMVGYWRAGRYLPTPALAVLLSEELDDTSLVTMVTHARTVSCPNCGITFDRKQSRKRYCSMQCQRRAHLKGGVKAPDIRQEAIDAMCRACEPEGTCRDDGCALRPFSPLLFVAMRRSA